MTDEKHPTPNISPIRSDDKRSIAVAIQGGQKRASGERSDSPAKVIASGYGKLAEQIIRMAFDKGIKVRADADLASLLATLDLETPIPSEAIIAVAEILSRVYEANAQQGKSQEGPHA